MIFQVCFRAIVGLVLGGTGLVIGSSVDSRISGPEFIPWNFTIATIGLLLGSILVPYAIIVPIQRMKQLPGSSITLGITGLLVGLLVAALLTVSLGRIPGVAGVAVPIVASLALGTLGVILFVNRQDLLIFNFSNTFTSSKPRNTSRNLILLDTSAIIDGRITDVAATGFLTGVLGVPQFILNELQHIADSSDPLRRTRGRRGLEVLHKLRDDSDLTIEIIDREVRNGLDVDAMLVQTAREMGAAILTTDYNLNRVAGLQGVYILNVNDLANALKPVVLPGEEMPIKVIQEGREPGQGVGFLDDGTMVVIESGRRFINSHLDVAVTRILQTAAGRIIFAQPKTESR